MDTIKNYLESMFAGLPNTPDVQKAKSELWQMMDDKYSELIAEGKAENEAIGIVISEFGNLEEIADSLGIRGYMAGGVRPTQGRMLNLAEAKKYISDRSSRGFMIGLAILLFITSPVGFILAIPPNHYESAVSEETRIAIGLILFFSAIATGIALTVYSSIKARNWAFLRNEPCCLDFSTVEYVNQEKQHTRASYAMLITVGIVLCVVSVVPVSVIGILDRTDESVIIGSALIFVLIGLGIMMMIYASVRNKSYEILLRVNPANTVGGNFFPSQQGYITYTSPVAAAVMEEYNLTVLCLYLIWSFLTFDWLITWVIWPIAAIVKAVIRKAYAR